MNTGKTLFAQLMDFLPWTTFTRIVDRYGGDHRVRTLSCAEQYRSMAFAQLTYRESLRDIETCLSVHASKLYHMGFRQPVRRSTLADANERRDWRIHAALAQRLITQARTLYVDEELGLDLTNTVYALDSTTIALCLSVFPWAHFRTTKAAVKMHTLLDLRGNIPSFIHISDGKLHDVHALDMLLPEAGAIYVVDRGYVDFARLYVLHQAGAFFVTRAKSNIDAHRVYSAPSASFATRPSPWITPQDYVNASSKPSRFANLRAPRPESRRQRLPARPRRRAALGCSTCLHLLVTLIERRISTHQRLRSSDFSKGTMPPTSNILRTSSGNAGKVNLAPVDWFAIAPAWRSIEQSSPFRKRSRASVTSITGKPPLIAFRMKIPAQDSTTTQETPTAWRRRDPSLLEPHPKFSPATTMSPLTTFSENSGLIARMQ